ncbi:MAG: regulatory iron-sulfur-containing complex subunit RicT [Kiritimatiellia bacterium]|nr:regulatory iron-sulfur-containing complex subunit RicT [Kiritimatiellia bacterium]
MFRLLHVDCGDIHLWQCNGPSALAINKGDACIVQKDSFLEFGHVVMDSGDSAVEIKGAPLVIRRATLQDQAAANENVLLSKNAWRICQEKVTGYNLPLRVMRVHYAFDRSRLAIMFTAEERIDFRQLVHDLENELHVRAEMNQIGARDAAALHGGLAPCGRIMCCKSWLQKFDNVHVSLAKNQGLPLRQASINGMCGRLKCCLRFEYFSSHKSD